VTGDKIIEVIEIYERKLAGVFVTEALAHVRTMLPRVKNFVTEGRLDKAFRWLGFIQGVLWAQGIYSIDEMKTHNKSREGEDA
jgi:hypothetical protein